MEEMKGVFIYKANKGKTVYYDWFSKEPHYINRSDYKVINLFQLSLPACVLLVYVLNSLLNLSLPISIAIVASAFVVAKIVFNIAFISKLPVAKNFERPKQDNVIGSYLDMLSSTRLILMGILLTAFGVLTIVSAKINGYEGTYLILNYVLIVLAFVGAVIAFAAVIKRFSKKG